MESTLVAPSPCGTTQVKSMKRVTYTITPEDIARSYAVFTFEYSNGRFLLPNPNNCNLKFSFSLQQIVSVNPVPTCTVNPATHSALAGSSPEFSVSISPPGYGPFTYQWTGPNGFASTNATVIITNVSGMHAGVYTATVTDQFGCSSTCSSTLTVSPQFSNSRVEGPDLILSGSGGTSNATYIVLATTNYAAPMLDWAPILTNTFDAYGQFTFTNRIVPSDNQRYFRLLLP
jgi:hypothetical protein